MSRFPFPISLDADIKLLIEIKNLEEMLWHDVKKGKSGVRTEPPKVKKRAKTL